MRRRAAAGAALVAALLVAVPAAAGRHTFRHDAVLGTSLELVVVARDPGAAEAAEEATLAAIDRLAAVASTYDGASEISRWLAAGRAARPGPELAAILHACDAWRERSGNAFHPGAALATAAWRRGERDGHPPSDAVLAALAARLAAAPWRWEGESVAPEGMPVSIDALAKGFIVDAACDAALAIDGVAGVMVNIGGDLAVRGELEQAVDIPDAGGPCAVRLADAAIATSGAGRRGFRVGDRTFSHVIDPRVARPAAGVRQATAIAPRAADADALATILCVLPPAEGLALVEGLPGGACLVVDASGTVHRSRGWPSPGVRALPIAARQDPAASASGDWNGGFELALDLDIVQARGGRRYRRPYVAAWVEDGDGFPVKTLLLWVQAEAPGPRWIPDLKRWAKADRLRKLAEGTDLVATISEPTRMPGNHGIVWDGRDTAGVPLPPGEYTVCVEAVREHGGYQFARRAVSFGTEPFRAEFPPDDELGGVRLDYRRRGGGDGG